MVEAKKLFFCESCGKMLQDASEVCCDCEINISETSTPNCYGLSLANPKNICPKCSVGFNKIKMIPWLQYTAWYKYQSLRGICPSCYVFLRSKYEPIKAMKFLIFGIFSFRIIFGYLNAFHVVFTWLTLFFCIVYFAITSYREANDVNKYIIDI